MDVGYEGMPALPDEGGSMLKGNDGWGGRPKPPLAAANRLAALAELASPRGQ